MKIEKYWLYNDYRCVVVMTDLGHRCGYIGVPEGHALHGVDYNLVYDVIDIDVHGGLTYSGGCGKYPVESNLWFIGFDCAHLGDGKDLTVLSPQSRAFEEMFPSGGILRSLEYCIKECENVVNQIIEGGKA